MKTRTLAIASLLLLSMMAAAPVVHAQQPLVVNIPFEFVTTNATLPAGEYYVERLGQSGELLAMKSADAHAAAVVMTIPTQAKSGQWESHLVFNRYGNRYFLSQIWTSDSLTGRELLKSSREKELAKVARIENHDQVIIAARISSTRP